MNRRQQPTLPTAVTAKYQVELEKGAIVTAAPGRVRIRPRNDTDAP